MKITDGLFSSDYCLLTTTLPMIDTHCHLTDPRLQSQLPDVLARASAAGVTRMITIGTSLEDAQSCLELCKNHQNVRCAIGVHPNYSRDVEIADLNHLRGLQL